MGGLISLMAMEAEKDRPDVQGLLLLSAAIKIHPDAGPSWLIALARIAGCVAPWVKPPRTFGVETVTRNKVVFSFKHYKICFRRINTIFKGGNVPELLFSRL